MRAKIYVFDKHIPEIQNYVKFGRDLYRNGILVVFDPDFQLPRELEKEVKQTIYID